MFMSRGAGSASGGKTVKIGINGFGRIGRQAFKVALEHPEAETGEHKAKPAAFCPHTFRNIKHNNLNYVIFVYAVMRRRKSIARSVAEHLEMFLPFVGEDDVMFCSWVLFGSQLISSQPIHELGKCLSVPICTPVFMAHLASLISLIVNAPQGTPIGGSKNSE